MKIDGEDALKRKEEKKGEYLEKTYYLRGLERYMVSMTRVRSWKLEGDPIYWATSPYIVADGMFKVTNKLHGRKLIFQEVGGGGIFEKVEGDDTLAEGCHLRRRVKRVLLPRQGFQIIIF